MKHPFLLPLSVAALAMALAVAQPAMAKPEGKGQHRGGGHSSVRGNGGSHSGKHASAYRGERRSHGAGGRVVSRDGSSRGVYRGNFRSGERRQYAGGSPRIGSRSTHRSDTRYRDRQPEVRAERRWRDGGRVRDSRTYVRDGRSYGGYERPSYSSRIRYRHDGPIYAEYRPRYYYTTYFPRPRYVYRSGFALGFVIGVTPSYGYRYFDPYCGISFHHLGAYYDHCCDHSHAELILIISSHGSHPIASCVYRGGGWVVDDCYDDRYDEYYDDYYDDRY